MRAPSAALALAVLALSAGAAHATDLPAELTDLERVVSVEMGRGHARVVVRRTVTNSGAAPLPASLDVSLNPQSAVTGLRILSSRRWLEADLREAGDALDRYRASYEGAAPPVLLSWRGEGALRLDLPAVPARGEQTVEYTLLASTFYSGGRDHYPLDGGDGDVAVKAARPGDTLFADEASLGAAGTVARGADGVELTLARAGARGLGGSLAVVPLPSGRALVRARVEAAPVLTEAPRGARVVLVIDTSRSLDVDEIRAEAAAAGAYLAHMPGAKVETLLFDRRVTAVHGGFVPKAKAIQALAHLAPKRGNGSRLDDALARAASLFEGLPPRVPRRLVVLTDGLTRRALDPDTLRGLAARTGALVHVGVVAGVGTPRVERDDAHPLARMARATGGLAWRTVAEDASEDAAPMRAAFEAWARPLRVDGVRIIAPRADTAAWQVPAHLDAGEGWADLRVLEQPIGWLKIEGELWSQPVATVLVPDADEARVAAAFAIGSSLRFDSAETPTLATLAHAVSPVTSLVATQRGVRAAPARPEEGGGIDGGCLCQNGPGWLAVVGPPAPDAIVDLDAALRRALAPGWEACGGAGRTAWVTIETTYGEVVDVTGASVSGPADPRLLRCLAEAAWALELPEAFRGERRSFGVTL